VEDDGAAFFIFAHQARVLEMHDQGILSLDSGIGDGTNFFAVELLPFLVVELDVERRNILRGDEVDERISNIALVFEIDGQIKEVICSLVVFINSGKQHFLAVLVGNVLDHQGGSRIFASPGLFWEQNELQFVVMVRGAVVESFPRGSMSVDVSSVIFLMDSHSLSINHGRALWWE